ncbi:MAG: alpha/beta hydrolase [Rhizobiaceae bacterium]
MYFAQRSMLFPGAALGPGPVSNTPPWGERITIATGDGERLEAFHSDSEAGRPTAIFFHGNADTITNYAFLANALSTRGIGLLALSYRGFGGSTGSPSETGLIDDGLAAFDWLAARDDGPIFLVGQSLGSAVAVAVAAERQMTGVVLISAPDSILALARRHYPFLPVGPLIRDPFRSDLRIGEVHEPKLFLHGSQDTIIPLSHGRALFELAPEPKEIQVLNRYGHNDVWDPTTIRMVADFIENLAGNAPAN